MLWHSRPMDLWQLSYDSRKHIKQRPKDGCPSDVFLLEATNPIGCRQFTEWTMTETDYYWIVLCKNHRFHTRQNLFSPRKIVLGETDAYSSPPCLQGHFRVKCDDCGEEHSYKPHDVLRLETEPPTSFVAHPLFSEVPLSQERKPA
jgi:hypothetical protein